MPAFEGKHALIIEDDETSIIVLQKMLQQLGVAVSVIRDNITVSQQLSQIAHPDVIFLDLEMPYHHGYTVLGQIRDIAAFHHTPIIAYTTHTSHMVDSKKAGFDGFLGKPLDSRLFPDQFSRILAGEAVWEVTG